MDLKSNTVFITGGATGIGRGLAEAFHQLGNRVIVGGRREEYLQAVCHANPGMEYCKLDVRKREQIQQAAAHLTSTFPKLNCLINNAGVQRAHDFRTGDPSLEEIAAEIQTNFTGLVQLCSAFLPHLQRQQRACLINVSSGLGLIPLSRVPVYSATKAAVHSFTQSLRHQLRNTNVEVVELIPPSVATDLRASRPQEVHSGPPALALKEYIAETMKALGDGEQEIAVGTARHALAATSSVDCSENLFPDESLGGLTSTAA